MLLNANDFLGTGAVQAREAVSKMEEARESPANALDAADKFGLDRMNSVC